MREHGEIAPAADRHDILDEIEERYGQWDVGRQMLDGSTLGSAVTSHLTKNTDPEFMTNGLRQLEVNSTAAFRDEREPEMLGIMPIAAHQEADFIVNTLEQYAKQEDAPPHKIVLLPNWPQGADQAAVDQTFERIDTFMREHPEVPLGYVAMSTTPETTIAELRGHASNFALSLLLGSQSSKDALLFTHDADLAYLNPRHLHTMHQAFTKPNKLVAVVTPAVRRERQRDENGEQLFPHMDTVLAWSDLAIQMPGGYLEMGNGISVRAFAAVNGYDSVKREGETIDVIDRMLQGVSIDHPARVVAPGAKAVCSSRREYSRLQRVFAPLSFWTGDFSATEDYRTKSTADLTDIPLEKRDVLVVSTLTDGNFATRMLRQRRLTKGHMYDKARTHIERVVEVGRLLLGGGETLVDRVVPKPSYFFEDELPGPDRPVLQLVSPEDNKK